MAATKVALKSTVGNGPLRLSECSRWAEREACGQECLAQIQEAPKACLVWTIINRWYQGHGALPDGDRNQLKAGVTIHGGVPESVFKGIQDSVASCFKEFPDLLHLINLDAHFIQRFAKVNKKSIEMPIV